MADGTTTRQRPHYRVYREMWTSPQVLALTPAEVRVLVYLGTRAPPNVGVRISSGRLARELQLDERTARRALDELEELRFLDIERTSGGARGETNRYYLLPWEQAAVRVRVSRTKKGQAGASPTPAVPEANTSEVNAIEAGALDGAALRDLLERLQDQGFEDPALQRRLGQLLERRATLDLVSLAEYEELLPALAQDAQVLAAEVSAALAPAAAPETPPAEVATPIEPDLAAEPEAAAEQIVAAFHRDVRRSPTTPPRRKELRVARGLVEQHGVGAAWGLVRAAVGAMRRATSCEPASFLYLLPHLERLGARWTR